MDISCRISCAKIACTRSMETKFVLSGSCPPPPHTIAPTPSRSPLPSSCTTRQPSSTARLRPRRDRTQNRLAVLEIPPRALSSARFLSLSSEGAQCPRGHQEETRQGGPIRLTHLPGRTCTEKRSLHSLPPRRDHRSTNGAK